MKKTLLLSLHLAILALVLVIWPLSTNAQLDVNRLRKAAQEKVSKESKTEKTQETAKETPKPSTAEREASTSASNLVETIKAEQAKIASSNLIRIKEKIESVFDIKDENGDLAHLSFTNDFTKPNEKTYEFSGKDFIYAKLNISKPLTQILPESDDYKMEYYRVRLTVTTPEGYAINDNKLSKKEFFDLAYADKDIMIPLIPEKGFYESLTEKYKEKNKFKDFDNEYNAYSDIQSRNFPSEIADHLNSLSKGEHRVEVELSVLAKKRGSEFVEASRIKGVFKLTVDDEGKQRYADLQNMLPTLKNEYEGLQSIASQKQFARSEEAMLERMSPRERERYQIAKSSSGGYMAAYGGKKFNITFVFDKHRNKSAHIDIRWPDGSCATCENGTATAYVTDRAGATYEVPEGAKITFNGRVLVPSVSGSETVTIYWYY